MLFHVQLSHAPENCWARPENEGKASTLVDRMAADRKSFGASVLSAYVAPNEHTFYLVVESETFDGVTALLGPPVLQDHDADIVPVSTFGEAMKTLDVE